MAEQLKVGVSADISNLSKGLDAAEKDVVKFGLDVDKSITKTEVALTKFGKTAAQESKKTGVSFQGLSRTLQDAAFGPGAIANNLAELGRDFTDLSKVAKESGQSIGKTLIQSLAGAGGLNLALGGLTLALSLASFGLTAWTKLFGENEKAVKSDQNAIDSYINSLKGVEKATTQGTLNAQEELTNLKLLFSAYQNANIPLKERREAYSQLQEQYPAYFGNIEFEEKASKRTKAAYDQLTQSILATARARAASELIARNQQQILINEQQISKIESERPGLIKAAANARKLDAEAQKLQNGERVVNLASSLRALNTEKKVAESIGSTNELRSKNNALNAENLKLIEAVNANLIKGGKIIETTGNIAEKATIKREKLFFLGLRDTQIKLPPIIAPTLTIPEDVRKRILEFNSQIAQDFIDLGAIVRDGLNNAFSGIGESLGQAIVNGTSALDALGQAVLGTLGDVLVQFGKLTIAAGVAALGLSAALSNPLNPASAIAAIAAGTALVAIGSAVKAFSKSVSSGGGGGGGNVGGLGPQIVSSGFNPSAPVAGTGNSGPMTFIPSTIIKGTDIVVSYNRTTALNSRSGL